MSTVLGALGEFIDIDVLGGSTASTHFFDRGIDPVTGKPTISLGHSFGDALFANIKSAGIGALSAYLTAELVQAVGLNGVPGEVANSAGGAVISQIITNLPNVGNTYTVVLENGDKVTKTHTLFEGISSPTFIASVAASYLGGKLASAINTPESVGGQIGSAVGGAYGSFVAAGILASGPLSPVTFAAAVIAVAFWTLVGGAIGSIFGGTPRSGADAAWDAAKGEFVVANAYARKGGSKDAAVTMAGAVKDNLNAVLGATGATLLDPDHVQSGNYGMRKKDYVYRPISTTDKDAITARFSGKDGAGKLIAHGTYLALTSMVGELAGGDVYVKRALAGSLATAGGNPSSDAAGAAGQFDITALLGDVGVAGDYAGYLANAVAINALIAADPQTAFAAGWLVTLARATELGLDRRGATDWTGGYVTFLDEAGDGRIDGAALRATQLSMGVDEITGERFWSVVDADGVLLGMIDDTIQRGAQTVIGGTAAADTIDLRTGALVSQVGYTVNGRLNDDLAESGADFVAGRATLGLAAGSRVAVGGVVTVADGLAEAGERFEVALGEAAGARIVGRAAVVTIVAADALPTLTLGRAYAAEGDGHAVFRIGLSKAAAGAVTLDLALLAGRATAGVDYASAFEVSGDGLSWTQATRLTIAAGAGAAWVRVAVIADNGVDDAGRPSGIEGNETFTLNATITAGGGGLANAGAVVSGVGTIIDGGSSDPYVWIDDQVAHEGEGAPLYVLRSRADGGAGSVSYTTSDLTRLDIAVAATVDGGAGDDTIHASNLGDNLFGGAGDDTLYGGRLDDWLLGGDGDDALDAGSADVGAPGGDGNYLDGGAGDDSLRGREGSDWLDGGDGIDILVGGAGDDVLAGGAGDGDDLKGGPGDDQYLVRLGDGADVSEDASETGATGAPVSSGAGDHISRRFAGIAAGTIRRDWIGTSAGVVGTTVAGGEDGIVFGQGIEMGDIVLLRSSTDGDDLIVRVMQTVGETTSFSGTQLTVKDWFGNPFKRVEWLKFIDGNEVRIGDIASFVIGGAGNDVLIGTAGNDFAYGGGGDDRLYLMQGDDIGNGGSGNDMVVGDAGRDLLLGGQGMDELIGGKGADVLSGDGEADDLYGGGDGDILSGGRGDGDQVVGGAGNDTFKYARGDGRDTMFDDFTANWQTVWVDGMWSTAAGYSFNKVTGEVTGPDGTYLRRNVGTAAAPDLQWIGRFDYDADAKSLRYFDPPAGAAIVANNGVDTIELAPGIDIQDIVLSRAPGSNDITLSIADENSEFATAASIADSVTIKDWYALPGNIEKLAFYQTGVLDISAGATNLIAGTDRADAGLNGTAGADWISGGAGDDAAAGGEGDDIIAGNSGSDALKGEAGEDVLYGGAGNDTLDGGLGADTLVGGAGIDTASYLSAGSGVRAYLSNADANSGDAASDVYAGIENLAGGGGGDVLGGDEFDNELSGGLGADTLLGGAGNDTYLWNMGDGADTIRDASFAIDVAVTIDGALASGYTQTLWQSTGERQPGYSNRYYWRLQITGPDGQVVYDYDRFAPTNGNGTQPDPAPAVYNAAGWQSGFAKTNGQQVTRERFDATIDAGDDVLEFGAGISLSDLELIVSGGDLVIRIGGSATSQVTLKDHFTANSRIETLQFRDGLGVSLASVFAATGGDLLTGTADDDLLVGRAGAFADQLDGGAGNDVLSGGAGDDRLWGGAGDDQIEGGAGADMIDGGANSTADVSGWGDTVRYVRSSAGVRVDLRITDPQSGGDAAGDVLVGIENITGSNFADYLIGNPGGNRIDALDGDNVIDSKGGDDVLVSGSGADQLFGGAGDDAIATGAGNDQGYGGDGDDTLNGGEGNDALYGEAGRDTLIGGDGNDQLFGDEGDDTLIGGSGNDTIDGGVGNDKIYGAAGSDTLQGGEGDDVYTVDASSGDDFIIDLAGRNAVVFDGSVSFDQLWLTRSYDDLRIGVIGSTARVTLVGYFSTGARTIARSVSTTTHALFLGYSTALIDAMTAIQMSTPSAMPDSVKALLATYWHAGGKAAPQAAEIALTISEDTPGAATAINAIDPDENITGYVLGAVPASGTVTIDVATGRFVYTPTADFNGVDQFSVVVQDADGNSTDVVVKVTVAAVNDAPRALRPADGAVLAIAEGGTGSPTLVDAPVTQFVASDVEGDALTFSLADDAGGRFEITGGGLLVVRAPALLDHEAAAAHVVRLRVTDAQGASTEQDFTVAVGDRNEANALAFSQAMSVRENEVIGTVVGRVEATDTDDAGTAFGRQRYYFLDGGAASATSADGRYAIDAVSGVVRTAAGTDYEGGASAAYTVIARDNDGQPGYNQASTSITIGITDVNEANALQPNYAWSVSESAGVGTTIGTVVATDTDAPGTGYGQQRYYFLDAGTVSGTSADGRYTIDAVSGVIRTGAVLNFEGGPASSAYTIVARDNQGEAGYNQAATTVTIGVADANDPNSLPTTHAASVAENVAIGTAVTTIQASDPDAAGGAFGQQRYYFLHAGAIADTSFDGRYTIDAVTGTITTAGVLDFEAGTTSAAYTVVARDNAGMPGYNQASTTVTIGVTDVNEANGIAASYAMSVGENAAIGTDVGTVSATDQDDAGSAYGRQRYYFLIGGAIAGISADGRYAIDATTGTIRTAAALDFEAGVTSVAYTVVARDNQGDVGYNEATTAVTIGVRDVNEANSLPSRYDWGVAENVAVGTQVGTVVATDADAAGTAFGRQRYYFLSAGTASATSADGRYTIDATSGAIRTATAIDFESGPASTAYTVVARDNEGNAGFNQASTTVTIGVQDVNEANAMPSTHALTTAENRNIDKPVGTIAATDLDGGGAAFGQQRYYFLQSGNASGTSSDGRYTIDAVTGEIKTAVVLDFENGPISTAYTVVARDNLGGAGYNQASTTVTIGVTDVNEAASMPASYAMGVAENAAVGTQVGKVTAIDPDTAGTAFAQQRYYFLNGATASGLSNDGRYAIDAASGIVTTASGIDYEGGAVSTAYTVVARDNQSQAGYLETRTTVTISVSDVNEANSLANYTLSVAENVALGTVVGQVAATDLDRAGTIHAEQRYYFLTGGAASVMSADGRYAIDAVTGRISTAATVDFENNADGGSYTVIARDNHGAGPYFEARGTVTIGVTDTNEANALPVSYGFGVTENVALGTQVGKVTATDPDIAGTAFALQRYYFLNGAVAGATSADGRYTIDAVSGTITTAAALDYEGGAASTAYTVVARDNQGQPGYNEASTTVTIGVLDVNEANALPVNHAMPVDENAAIGANVGAVVASDLDGAGTAFGQQRYYFLDAGTAGATSGDGRYAIDAVSGMIRTAGMGDFESGPTSAAYTMVARDNQGQAGYNQASTTVTIALRDVNEANAMPSSFAMAVNENAALGTVVGTVTASDQDARDTAFGEQRFYFLVSGNASATSADGRYAIDAVSGVIRTVAPLDFEAGPTSTTHAVIARDNRGQSGYNQASSTVTIGVRDVNEAPTTLNWSPTVAAIEERDRVAAGTTRPAIRLGALSVSDPDTAGTAAATYGYAVSDTRFQVIDNALWLRLDAALDYEAGETVAVIVTGADATGTPFSIQRDIVLAVANRDDVAEGDAGANTLFGQQNRDILYGYGADDTLSGGAGDDLLYGGDGTDLMLGGQGNDVLYGGENAVGTTERLYGDSGDDTLYGEGGDDVLTGGQGADALIGGAGTDLADYSETQSGAAAIDGVVADLASSGTNAGAAAGDTYAGIENLRGTAAADTLAGDAGANALSGLAGADVLRGRGGDDVLDGGAGGDTLYGDDGADLLQGGDGDDTIYGGAGNDMLLGGAGNDTLSAEWGDDILDGGAGDDVLNGGLDNDTYIVTTTSGIDTIYNYDPSGDDIDTLGFRDDNGRIDYKDLWFERAGDDMRVTIIGATSGVVIKNWYVLSDANSRANYKIDFVLTGQLYSKTIDVEGLVGLMAGRPMPADAAARDALMQDLEYRARWATYWHENGDPVISAVPAQTIDEGSTAAPNMLTLTVTVTDDITPNANIQLSASVVDGTGVISASNILVGPADANGRRSVSITPTAYASGTATIRLVATDAGGVTGTRDFTVTVNPVASMPTIARFVGGAGSSGLAAGIPLDLDVSFPDQDGSEVQRIFIFGVPAAVTLSAGSYDPGGQSWILAPAQAAGLKVFAPSGWSQDLTLTVVARVKEGDQIAQAPEVTTTVVINAPPTSLSFSGSVGENAAYATVVGTVSAVDPDGGDTLSYTLLDDAGGRFALSAGGVLKVANGALLDFEAAPSHDIVVRVTDPFGQYRDQAFAVALTDTNEANSLPATHSLEVREDVAVGTLAGTIAATDADAAGTAFGEQRYYFLSGGAASGISADGRYAIDAVSGAIRTAAALDYEAGSTSVAYTVVARDNRGAAGYNQASSTVTIGVRDTNEANALPANYAMAIAENVPLGTLVGTVQATDADGAGTAFARQRYFFLNGGVASASSADGRYTIDADSGQIRTAAPADFEAGPTSVAYTVVARDNQGAAGYNQASTTVTIGLTDANEANALPPSYGLSVAENVAIGTLVGTIQATDPDGPGTAFGQQRYQFWNGGATSATSADGRYTIDAETGAIRTAAVLDYEAGTTSVSYTVAARDNRGGAGYFQALSSVTIAIEDRNEANALPATHAMAVDENVATGTILGTIVASDPDGAGTAFGQQRYYFYDGGAASATSSDGRYTIDAVTGAIRTAAAPDFEGGRPTADYVVVARDNQGAAGFNQAFSTVTIAIRDRNEANAIAPSHAMAVDENVAAGTVVGRVQASDLDGAGTAFGQQRYYFLSGVVASATSVDGRYTIDTVSGTIRTVGALDFEAGDATASYIVAARDNQGGEGYNQVTTAVTITIDDRNEANAVPSGYALSVAENVAIGTGLGTIRATDQDGAGTAFGQQRYYFLNGGAVSGTSSDGRYAIDAVSGLIRTAAALDFEAGNAITGYTVAVRDNQGAVGYHEVTTAVTISVGDVNEANTIPIDYALSVSENVAIGSSVGGVLATDQDGAGTAFGEQRYYFLNNGSASAMSADGRYAIDAVSGAIVTAAALDFEAGPTSTIYTVVARDNRGAGAYNEVSTAVTIGIRDANEANALPASRTFSVAENVAINGDVGQVAATDLDGGGTVFGQQRYYFSSNGAASTTSIDGRYTIDAVSGMIRTAIAPDYEAGPTSAAYIVLARDNSGEAGYNQASTSVTIGVTDVNEANALPASHAMAVAEGAAIDTVVGTVAATDPDGAGTAFGQQRYYFLNGNTASERSIDGRYRIDAVSGAIHVAAVLDYEAGPAGVAYTIVSRDNQGTGAYNQAVTTVTIGVTDINEANALPAAYSAAIAENAPINTAVVTIAATDPDSAGSVFAQQRYYFMYNGVASATSFDGRYTIDRQSGTVYTAAALDYESGPISVAYTVVACDNLEGSGYREASTTLTIGIGDANEATTLPGFTAAAVTESGALGTHVMTIVASDPDRGLFGEQRYAFAYNGTLGSLSHDGRYRIDALTGAIATAAGLDYEAGPTSVDYTVVARDNRGDPGYTQAQQTVRIAVTDVNEANAFAGNYAFGIAENSVIGSDIGAVGATDIDAAGTAFGQQRYYFWNGGNAGATSQDGRYSIDAVTGLIRSAAGLDFEAGEQTRGYTIVARDNQGTPAYHQAFTTVTIGIYDVNEANWFPSAYGFGVSENVAAGSYVGTVTASDIDSAASAFGQQRYYFSNNGAAAGVSIDGRYAIDIYSGAITVAGALDYESNPNTSYTVVARDNQGVGAYRETTTTLSVAIQNVNEAHTMTAKAASLNEGFYYPGAMPASLDIKSMLYDPDVGAPLIWSFADGSNQSGIFQIDSYGNLSLVAGTVDYEELIKVYEYQEVYVDGPNPYEPGYYETRYVYVRDDPSRATFQLNVMTTDPTRAEGDPARTATAIATVSVTDVDETPTISSYHIAGNRDGKIRYMGPTSYYILHDLNAGNIIQVHASDPERRGIASYSISDTVMTENIWQYGGSSEIDATAYPYVYIDQNGRIGFTVPGEGDGEWEGGVRINGVRRTSTVIMTFNVNVMDSSGQTGHQQFTVSFIRRGSSVPPIVLDLDGDGLELVSALDSAIHFDMDLDGIADRTGWVAGDDGFLVLDRNGNGHIDDAGEMSFASETVGATSDLEGLRAFDTNANGFFDEGDARFADFRVWRDIDQDGVSQASELFTLSAVGIVQINLSLELTGQPEEADNIVYGTTDYLRSDGSSGTVGDVFLVYEPSAIYRLAAPIVLDLDGDGEGLVSLTASQVRFDMDGDGVRERTGWIESGDAFLALDRNNDGKISDISEISFVGDLAGVMTDLEGLRAFDSNGDGVLDALDDRFAEFKVWSDANSNGVSDAGEVRSLAEAGIASLDLSVEAGTRRDDAGNVVYGASRFTLGTGETGALLDTGLAYVAGNGSTSPAVSGWSGAATPATDTTFAARAVDVRTQSFGGKDKKYMMSALGGEMFIRRIGGGDGVDARSGLAGPSSLTTFRKSSYGYLAAIVLDFDGDGVETRHRKKSRAGFDMNGDGSLDSVGWVGRGDGLLVIDRDGDGTIDGPAELGFLADKDGARSMFDAMSALDANKDGKLDAGDARFDELRVWVDANDNGVTDAGELRTLTDTGIASISLAARAVSQDVAVGYNVMVATSAFTRADGTTGSVGEVGLAYKPAPASQALGAAAASPALSGLRDAMLRSTGEKRIALEVSPGDMIAGETTVTPDVLLSPATPPSPFDRVLDRGAMRWPVERPMLEDTREIVADRLSDAGDSQIALMTQHMASFGARSGETDWTSRSGQDARRFEYFAA